VPELVRLSERDREQGRWVNSRPANDVAIKHQTPTLCRSIVANRHHHNPQTHTTPLAPFIIGKMILPLVTLIAGSAYGLQLSYANITRLQQYEEQSEKAAEWSNKAAQRLHKTRTTQTSGTVTVTLPLQTPPIPPFSFHCRIYNPANTRI
jgi:hypothetical protein